MPVSKGVLVRCIFSDKVSLGVRIENHTFLWAVPNRVERSTQYGDLQHDNAHDSHMTLMRGNVPNSIGCRDVSSLPQSSSYCIVVTYVYTDNFLVLCTCGLAGLDECLASPELSRQLLPHDATHQVLSNRGQSCPRK